MRLHFHITNHWWCIYNNYFTCRTKKQAASAYYHCKFEDLTGAEGVNAMGFPLSACRIRNPRFIDFWWLLVIVPGEMFPRLYNWLKSHCYPSVQHGNTGREEFQSKIKLDMNGCFGYERYNITSSDLLDYKIDYIWFSLQSFIQCQCIPYFLCTG